ncbi:ABC transporter ATP-binding protein/permease [Paenibacillus sp. MER TA 81-3]|uniref:ABC transporter ATP-binding protein n=1 Tax=Paenibacillus sp. MER TA 81-3 TaxID=2939573 RepID=UPI002042350E|nr:ABC transporter ATP-binding protein [Paenibacillus sp. MER TA 81-3]MCM3340704.1 ABC transporter ATP-binding protein/permease [Paenibacillus sp. MER TA 81-3]
MNSELSEFARGIISYLRPYKKWTILASGSLLVTVILDVIVGDLINRMIEKALSIDQELWVIIAILIGTVIIGVFTTYFSKYYSIRTATLTIKDLREVLVAKIPRVPLSYIEKQKSGDIASKLSNDTSLIENFLKNDLMNLLYQPLVFIAAFCYLLFINWKMLIVSVIIIPTFMFLANYISKFIGKSTETYQIRMGDVSAFVKESIDGMEVINTFNLQNHRIKNFEKSLNSSMDSFLKIERLRSLIPPISMVSQAVPYAITILYGGYLTLHNELNPGQLLAFIYLLKYLVRPPVTLPWLLSNLRQASSAFKRISEIIRLPEEWDEKKRTTMANDQEAANFSLMLDGVSYTYNDSNRVLNKIDLHVSANHMIAIVGPSGSGKSTLIKIMCGLYEPEEGTVKIFGTEFSKDTFAILREKVSFVPQETFLFPVSISENIRYGKLNASESEIMNAAQASNASDFIMEMENAFETKILENGVNLSGGQKQRIGVARALVRNSSIIVFDEPTSSLDKISEEYIQNSISQLRGSRTIVIVTHRLSTIMQADEIYVMDKGRIISRGSHEELLRSCKLYQQLCSSFA